MVRGRHANNEPEALKADSVRGLERHLDMFTGVLEMGVSHADRGKRPLDLPRGLKQWRYNAVSDLRWRNRGLEEAYATSPPRHVSLADRRSKGIGAVGFRAGIADGIPVGANAIEQRAQTLFLDRVELFVWVGAEARQMHLELFG